MAKAKMAATLPWGMSAVDWQERINVERMRRDRLEKTKAEMRKRGIAVTLLTRRENIRYATGIRGIFNIGGLVRYALVFADHEPIMFEHGATLEHQKIYCTWMKPENLRLARAWFGGVAGKEAAIDEAKLFAKELKQALVEHGCEKETLAVDALDGYGVNALAGEDIHIVDGQDMMLDVRMVKTKDEINCLQMAATLCDTVYYKLWQELRPGVRDCEMVAAASAEALRLGAEGLGSISFYSGPNTFHQYRGITSTDRIIQFGDIVYADLVRIQYLGYNTCYYRTFLVGREPTEKEKDWYKQCLDTVDRVLEKVKPGNTTADAAIGFHPASKWGYSEEEPVLAGQLAHGIGLDLYEKPVINRQWSLKHPQVFEEGMTFAIETTEGEHLVGGARLEDMVVVTKDGAEIITRMFRDEILVANRMV